MIDPRARQSHNSFSRRAFRANRRAAALAHRLLNSSAGKARAVHPHNITTAKGVDAPRAPKQVPRERPRYPFCEGGELALRHLQITEPLDPIEYISDTSLMDGGTMAIAGLVVTISGFLVAAGSVGFATANGVRLVIVLLGIAISLGGIIGLINPAYQKNAAWKR